MKFTRKVMSRTRLFRAKVRNTCRYRGRSMADAHRGMEIEATEYDAACDDILGTMRALHYDAPTRGEVGEILQSLKPEITHV